MSQYGGIASRAIALAIDMAIANVAVFLLGAMVALIGSLAGGWHIGTAERVLAACAWAFVIGSYFVVCWSTTGQTPGMRAMGLRVIDLRGGGHPGTVRSLIRLIGLILAIIPLGAGFIPVLFDDRRRALQDFLAGTVVVYYVAPPVPA